MSDAHKAAGWRDNAVTNELRKRVLFEARGQCQIGLVGCTGQATEVDHVVPIIEGGRAHDRNNLRASCRSCNARLGAGLSAEAARQRRIRAIAAGAGGADRVLSGEWSRLW